MQINKKNLRNIRRKIFTKTEIIENNRKIMIIMMNMTMIKTKINKNRSMFQNKKMITKIQTKMKNIMKKEISKINNFKKHKVKM
jgi:hypothetical protein